MTHLQVLADRGVITIDSAGVVRLTQKAWRTMTGAKVLHFVGFKDDRWWNAVAVFGPPDFVHRHWDARAVCEICDGDIVVFAKGDEHSFVTPFAYDDSAHF